jgi:hypothetical protein
VASRASRFISSFFRVSQDFPSFLLVCFSFVDLLTKPSCFFLFLFTFLCPLLYYYPGAPISGSAVDSVDSVAGYVAIGYTFGFRSSVLFGSHYRAILSSLKPNLFIMGSLDGFTSVKTFKSKMSESAGNTKSEIVENVGHFDLESPQFDGFLAHKISVASEEVERSSLIE